MRVVAILSLVLLAGAAHAELTLKPQAVAPNVYAIVGDLGAQSYANEGLNNNLGFIVTDAGVVVVNSGPSVRVAKALHAAIARTTAQPIKWVINSNAQPHYWLGNGYFQSRKIPILAHKDAAARMRQDGAAQLETMRRLLKEKAQGTALAYPTQVFEERHEIALGAVTLSALYFGLAHTPGDIVVWLPQQRIAFAGDIVFTQRLLAALPIGDSGNWLTAFDRLAQLDPRLIVPGHGQPTELAHARRDTRDYLAYLREEIKARIARGESLDDAVQGVDQSRFKALVNFEGLAKRNANQIYLELERDSF